MAQRSIDLPAVEAEIERIRSLGLEALRTRWRSMFGMKPPVGLTKDLLVRMMAYRIQEDAFGGLDRATRKVLGRLADGKMPGREVRRRLKPGTVLVREYQGERHTVTVVPDGFVWREIVYGSLSTIARAITGTTWGGPRFFGLRSSAHGQEDRPPAAAPNKPKRPVSRSPMPRRQSGRSREVQA